jgi:Asp-tRNA(Asn)/Glu-tRNA(Gln) amidotransferase A subunit family amidase
LGQLETGQDTSQPTGRLFGWPCGLVRAGTGKQGNLPVGVQFFVAPWCEDIALALMTEMENSNGGFGPPPI